MSDLHKAAVAALEALEGVLDTYGEPLDLLSISGGAYEALQCRDAITALKAALAEPVQEPVAWMCPDDPERETAFAWKPGDCVDCGKQRIALYAAPPQRKPLTEEEIEEINRDLPLLHMQAERGSVAVIFARAIERAHRIGSKA